MGDDAHQDGKEDVVANGGAPHELSSPHEDVQLEIHKPKPVHSWREFINEIGVIVIGVLIALGGEQAVEAMHWHHVVGETKEVLTETVGEAYDAILSRQDMQSCVDNRLAEIKKIIDRHYEGAPVKITGPIGSPTASFIQTYALDMAIASQAFSHMSMTDQARFFEPIGTYKAFDEVIKEERSVWRELRALEHVDMLTAADWSDVRKAYDRASDLNAIFSSNLRSDREGAWLSSFRTFPKPAGYSLRHVPRVQQLCRPVIATGDGASDPGVK